MRSGRTFEGGQRPWLHGDLEMEGSGSSGGACMDGQTKRGFCWTGIEVQNVRLVGHSRTKCLKTATRTMPLFDVATI